MDLSEGQVFAGKYRIERVLGRGGMGLVVAATHLQLGELVALKFLLPEALHNPEAVLRFDREARAAVRIKSEHVARVSDVGTLDNGAPYMVMEYLEGVDLSMWLVQRGALPIEQAVEFVLQACEAIAEAHTLGIVHRDLKPANLFVIERPDGALAVKVLDFGISKSTGFGASGAGDTAGITKTMAAMGSPLYMSPEQMQSAKDVDLRGDIWALGVVLYELISARVPFPGGSMAEVVLKVVTAAPVALRSVCAQVPPGLEAVVLKCLEKDRNARYQSVAELALALLEFAPRRSKASVERIGRLMQRAGIPASFTQLPPSSEPADSPSAYPALHTLASWGQTNPPANHRRRAALVGAVLIAIPLLAFGVVALVRAGGQGATLASGAAPLGADTAAPGQSDKSALLVDTAPKLVPTPSSVPASNAPASSAPASNTPANSASSTVAHAQPPPQNPSSSLKRGNAADAPKSVAAPRSTADPGQPAPTPKAVSTKPAPATPVANPLKMSIQ